MSKTDDLQVFIPAAGSGRRWKTAPRYPAIDAAIKRRGGAGRFFSRTGICQTTYYLMQRGDRNPQKDTIDIILDYTGLTYETAFNRK